MSEPPAGAFTPDAGADDRLDSWKEIAHYLKRDVRTVQRWEATAGLPVHRRMHEGLKKGSVYAYRSELDAWFRDSLAVSRPAHPPKEGTRKRWRVGLVAAAVMAGGASLAFLAWRTWTEPSQDAPVRVIQLTDYPGIEQNPAFSPDGQRLAFSWNGKDQDNFDIYTRPVESGAPLRLTTDPARDIWPAWSPDGQRIAFLRASRVRPVADLLVVPALGGAERSIAECPLLADIGANGPAVTWTRDGRWLIAPYAEAAGGKVALALVSPSTPARRPLTTPPPDSSGDCCPVLSPDGRSLAFLRHTREGVWQVHVLPLDGDYRPAGEPRQLTSEAAGALAPMWGGGGRFLYYPASDRGAWMLWRMSPDGSGRRPVGSLFPLGTDWTASSDGARLAFANGTSHAEIWRMDLDGGKRVERLTSSTGARDFNPQYSPDGAKIAYMSMRPQGVGIWVADSEGNNAIEVARATGVYAAPPRWSPDGRRLVFECIVRGNEDVCTVSSAGGEIRRLTRHAARDLFPSWSSDGKWVLISSDRSGSFRVWRIPADGSEAGAQPLTEEEGYAAVQTPGGGPIYFATRRRGGQLFRIESVGGPATPVGSIRLMGRPQSFALSSTGVYFPMSERPEQWFEIWRCAPDGAPTRLARIEKRLTSGFSVSTDGRRLLFAAFQEQFGDIYLVDRGR